MRKSLLVRVVGLVLLLGAVGASLRFLPVTAILTRLLEHIQAMGPWGPILLAACYVIATVLFVPGTLLTLGAGFAFGVVRGVVAVSIGSTLGASAAWLLGRTLARELIERRLTRSTKFRLLDQAIGEQGFKVVLLLRLSPVFPYNLLNYALGLTRVSFRDYFLASWVGMFPATVLYVYLGSSVRSLADLAAGRVEGGTPQKILFVVGLLATVVVTVLVTRAARAALSGVIQASVGDQFE